MNATEKKYAVRRIEETGNLKINEIYHEEGETVNKFRGYECFVRAAIKTVKPKLQPAKTCRDVLAAAVRNGLLHTTVNCVTNAIEINTEAERLSKEARKGNGKSKEARQAKVREKVQILSDEVMLGDSKEAMKLIKAFASEKF